MKTCRTLAVDVIERVLNEGAYSNILLSSELNNSELNEKDRALATEITYGTLRRLRTIDDTIGAFVKDIKLMDRKILTILRIAIYQLKYLDKVPSYAVTNEAVEMAKEVSEEASKLVNGILRNYIKEEGKVKINFFNRIHSYAYQYSLEPWMIKLLIKQYGEEEAKYIMEGFNYTPGTSVRVNSLKGDYDEVYDELEEKGYEIEEGYICPESIIITGGKNIENNELFTEGKITVQDESAMLVAPILDLKEGDTVLDLCSAPGGKTTHSAELLNNTGKVLAFDIHEHKLALIKENCERLGITNVECDVMDATKLNANLVASSSKIILDVPCSGLGIVRRKPEIKWTKKRNDLKNIVEVQRQIMENAWEYLRNDGTLIYSTCTLNKEENEENVEWFLNKHKDCKIEKIFVGKMENLVYNEDGSLTVLPNEYMDGFYIAKLKKVK